MENFVHAEDTTENSSSLLTCSLFCVLGLSHAWHSFLGVLEVSGMCVPFAVCRNRSRSPSPPAAYGNVAAVIPNTWRSDRSSFPRSGGCGLPALRAGGCAGRAEGRRGCCCPLGSWGGGRTGNNDILEEASSTAEKHKKMSSRKPRRKYTSAERLSVRRPWSRDRIGELESQALIDSEKC